MDPSHSYSFSFAILGVCFIMSAFFSCAETALLSVSKIRIRTLVEEGNKRAKLVERLIDDTDSLLSTILVGNNLVNIGASSLSTVLAVEFFGDAGAGIATGAVTLVILIFGEITPKSIATKYADSISLAIAGIIHFFVTIFKPIVVILNSVTGFIVRLFGGDRQIGPTLTEEELKTYVTVSHEEGIIEEEEKEMIHNVFEFGDTEIKEVMTPRIHVVSISDDVTYDELLEIYKEQRFSRIPVHNSEDNDDIIGVLNVKDLLLVDIDKENFNVRDYAREAFIVYEFNHISDAFERMRSNKKSSLAIVLDEYGVMSGIVTIEDMIEEIVGEIGDEYDIEEETIKMIGENTFLIDGSVSFNEINDVLGTNFQSDDFESIGGLVLGEIGEPELHRELKIGRATLSIEKIHKNRIEQLKMVFVDTEKKDDN